MNQNFHKWSPVLLAVALGIMVSGYYVFSGRGSYEHNVRQLQENQEKVDHVATDKLQSVSGSKNSLTIKCKNGESYEIVFKEGQTNFDDLVYDKCGAQGVLEP